MTAKIAAFAVLLGAALPAYASSVTQTNLTASGAPLSAAFTDPNLVNAWGMSYSPTGDFWVSDNGSGLTTLYDGTGAVQSLVVTIPAVGGNKTGSPTGQVYNGTSGFAVTAGGKTGTPPFIFDSEDGSISAWAPSVNAGTAIVAVDRSSNGAVYKGLAFYTDKKGSNFLLATDFHGGNVDVFDSHYNLVQSFRDTKLAAKYSPYNVAVLGGSVYITYARVDKARHDSKPGPGFGAVEIVDNIGDDKHAPKVEHRFVHGTLNGPWGLALAPASWGKLAGDLLVGNFGSGQVSVFSADLVPHNVLTDSTKAPIVIDGLWGLIPGNGGSGGSASDIYFTAGPAGETEGLFGSLAFNP